MKLIKVEIELVIDNGICEMPGENTSGIYNRECIAEYLNSKLYTDPEFFGDFGPENITYISDIGF